MNSGVPTMFHLVRLMEKEPKSAPAVKTAKPTIQSEMKA